MYRSVLEETFAICFHGEWEKLIGGCAVNREEIFEMLFQNSVINF